MKSQPNPRQTYQALLFDICNVVDKLNLQFELTEVDFTLNQKKSTFSVRLLHSFIANPASSPYSDTIFHFC